MAQSSGVVNSNTTAAPFLTKNRIMKKKYIYILFIYILDNLSKGTLFIPEFDLRLKKK